MTAVNAMNDYDFDRSENFENNIYGNTAPDYDDDGFEYDDEPEKNGKIKHYRYEKYNKKKAYAKKNNKMILLTALIVAITCVVFCVDISGFAKGYELDREISNIEADIRDAQAENVRLNAAREAKTNIAKIEDYAENVLGMVPVEDYQIEKIDLSNGDKIINSAEE